MGIQPKQHYFMEIRSIFFLSCVFGIYKLSVGKDVVVTGIM